jgi:hypothetical protein
MDGSSDSNGTLASSKRHRSNASSSLRDMAARACCLRLGLLDDDEFADDDALLELSFADDDVLLELSFADDDELLELSLPTSAPKLRFLGVISDELAE